MPQPIRHLNALLAFWLLAACASAPEHFYTLSAVAPAAAAPPARQSAAPDARYSLAVGPVKVPEIVDRPQFVIRQGENRVDIVEQHRWAQPLRAEIASALADDLRRRLPQARVSLYNDNGMQKPDCHVVLNIERFDGAPGQAASIQGAWSLRCASPDLGQVDRTGRAFVQEPVRGDGYEELAAAYSRALSALAARIAQAASSLRS